MLKASNSRGFLLNGDHRAVSPQGKRVEKALIEMFLAGVSVRRVENITEAL